MRAIEPEAAIESAMIPRRRRRLREPPFRNSRLSSVASARRAFSIEGNVCSIRAGGAAVVGRRSTRLFGFLTLAVFAAQVLALLAVALRLLSLSFQHADSRTCHSSSLFLPANKKGQAHVLSFFVNVFYCVA